MKLPVRIVIVKPPAKEAVGVQLGHGGACSTDLTQTTSARDTVFNLHVEVAEGSDPVRFKGPYVQKDGKGQFIYLRWGTSAGDDASSYTRRTKLYFGDPSAAEVSKAHTDKLTLVMSLAGTGRDGGPTCATVPVQISWDRIP